MHTFQLAAGWQLRQRTPEQAIEPLLQAEDGWYAASVPGCVHEALIAADRLEDPFQGLNELGAQWIGETDWLYRCRFEAPAELFEYDAIDLACAGLDTIATVWLNGVLLFHSDNMFVPQRASIGDHLKPGSNELVILFESPVRIGREREATHGEMAVWNGEASRVYVRKAQYHYGWDWGPTLLTSGPWQPVTIEAYDARIADLHCQSELAADLSQAHIRVQMVISESGAAALPAGAQHAAHVLIAKIMLRGPDGQFLETASVAVDQNHATHTFVVHQPQLWWPNGYGDRAFYHVEVAIERGQDRLDDQQVRLGLRRLELVQEPLENEPGTTFMFRVNNTPIFCGGANWIPADSFTTRISAEHYQTLVRQAADAHMTMLRVWGGGIYEDQAFYEACDDMGILVWQDFLFACGLYPATDWFQASVAAEAEAQIKRLRHHPSLAIWCGNNEDYQIAFSLGRYDHTTAPDANSPFPARVLYEQILPNACSAFDPGRPYWPGSPYGGHDANSRIEGDRHTWDIWHGVMAPYQEYINYSGRFVSEFGMQSLPEIATIEAFAPPEERFPGSRTIEHHNKATGGIRRIAAYLADNLRPVATLEETIYATQLMQAEALANAYRGWRRRWGGPGRYAIAGALVWQINDCWPVTSWAIVDYYLRPKAAYYVIRRELAPLAVGLSYESDGTHAWIVNGTTTTITAQFELRTWTVEGDLVGIERADLTLPPNQVLELGQFGFGSSNTATILDGRLIIAGTVVARGSLWPDPLKYLRLPDPMIIMDIDDQETIRLRALRPAKGVLLSAGDGVQWSDNMIDLMPDDEQLIVAHGLNDRPVEIRWLQ
ncbi:MAG: glycoside hydrolase family 2 TIM barrel-domain containing protein [Roseiflexaceae bacterium]